MSNALLETMVNIILKASWDMVEAPVDVGMGGWFTTCKFCSFEQRAQFNQELIRGVNHYRLSDEHLATQEELENPGNHDDDCLWRLAKEYRT